MSRFKVGDKVKIIGSRTEAGKAKIGQVGEILDIDWKDGACFVLYPKGQDWVRETDLALVTSTPTDKKREFLERLQSLMREFDAEVVFSCDHTYKTIKTTITIGDTNIVRNEVYGVCADNIMDFDEERV